jgi:hypothetical protein
MKVIKGEKYIIHRGKRKGEIFRVTAFTPYHIAGLNLSNPSDSEELIPKFYFAECFKEYQHSEMVKLNDLAIQQIIFVVNDKIKEFVINQALSESVFRLIANDVGEIVTNTFKEY